MYVAVIVSIVLGLIGGMLRATKSDGSDAIDIDLVWVYNIYVIITWYSR